MSASGVGSVWGRSITRINYEPNCILFLGGINSFKIKTFLPESLDLDRHEKLSRKKTNLNPECLTISQCHLKTKC